MIKNPLFLKPGTDTTSQLIVLGQPVGDLPATWVGSGWAKKGELLDVAVDAQRERLDEMHY